VHDVIVFRLTRLWTERTNERSLFANERKTLTGYQYRPKPIKAGHQKKKLTN